ncbi:MAG: tyrosine-type recombinase/integrase [Hydrogenophaga sp.]|uniref:tyrosine-type recombinase/integrase n=1 Tax=Hydrogenophaga sp. TaxID=1904254 RepID=UPI0027316FF1|nr:tyrosine-type recombinase/integrase [Hydrogenophaga sp.]MDP2250685.1 tyrosine-type recombinase/integrase [Hydrogenophaga sp.]MDP3205413.1 tyrosine-type recombinase/integrase [Hydrogenophaga sp.]MDP3625085.1 tyrosine-type recombinase/integrase [Hydrogenophaga sp.]
MKTDLDLKLIKSLTLEQVPVGHDASGRLLFKANPRKLSDGFPNEAFVESYILWDSSRASPPGFGVRVASKKTYVLRRKVNGRSIQPTVGNVADFNLLDLARKRAAAMALVLLENGRNPNEVARQQRKAELTLGEAMARYRHHLVTRRQKPAREATLLVFDRVVRKLNAWNWSERPVKEITTDEIERRFLEGSAHSEANEQAFRWPTAAVRWCIDNEALAANAERRSPHISANPFDILTLNRHYRTQSQKNLGREEQSKRNPLKPGSTLGPFLEAAWSKRLTNDNETGVHYLLLMLLWGCRQSEHAGLCWGELLLEHGERGLSRKTTSHVWLGDDDTYGPYVFFFRTKNDLNHRLPLTPMVLNLLRLRQESAALETQRRGFGSKSRMFVFPARSRYSKSGHYTDSTDLLRALREEINVEKLSRHDLRRSFGAVMTSIDVPEGIKKKLLNHAASNVTDTYTRAEWVLLRDWMTKIEQAILAKAPNVFNALKPADWPWLPAPEPHVCRPVKPRSGRPKEVADEFQFSSA